MLDRASSRPVQGLQGGDVDEHGRLDSGGRPREMDPRSSGKATGPTLPILRRGL